jgi:hypothetical protein
MDTYQKILFAHDLESRQALPVDSQHCYAPWPFRRLIDIPYGHLQSVLDWCGINLGHDWRWSINDSGSSQYIPMPGYIFWFLDGADAVAFELRWKKPLALNLL